VNVDKGRKRKRHVQDGAERDDEELDQRRKRPCRADDEDSDTD